MIDQNKFYLFYDGDCGFCNFWVHWILKNDFKDQFLFASLQGKFGQEFLRQRGLEQKNLNTIYLWKPEKYYLNKSNAAITIAEKLGGIYSLASIFRIIPRFLRDWVYDCIARNRHRLIKNSCAILTPEQQKKFID